MPVHARVISTGSAGDSGLRGYDHDIARSDTQQNYQDHEYARKRYQGNSSYQDNLSWSSVRTLSLRRTHFTICVSSVQEIDSRCDGVCDIFSRA